jgi:hypothetical protein
MSETPKAIHSHTLTRSAVESDSIPGLRRGTDFIQQIRQDFHAPGSHVRELPLVQLANHRIEALQQLQSAARNSRFHHSPIVALPLARNQLAFFHAIQQTRYVRVVRNHALAYAAAGQPLRFRPAQYAQHVVLRSSKPV